MKSISSAFLCILMLMVCACGNQGKNSGLFHQGKDSIIIIAVNTSNGIGYFVDSAGTFLFNKQFEHVSPFTDGLARVEQNGKWGFINTKGEVVIPCIYDFAWAFSEGLAEVKQNGKGSIINKEGKVIVAEYGWTTSWSKVEME